MTTMSKEAPGQLAVVREFVNTLDIDHGLDELSGRTSSSPGWPVTTC